MLAVCLATQSFSAPTAQVAQPVIRASAYVLPVQMAETPSRRAMLFSAAALMAVPLAAQANPEDYVGGYTNKDYEKTYAKYKEKSDACPAPGGPYCAGPGGSAKDPLIAFSITKDGPPPIVEGPKKKEPEPAKKDAAAAPKPAA